MQQVPLEESTDCTEPWDQLLVCGDLGVLDRRLLVREKLERHALVRVRRQTVMHGLRHRSK